jgi:hypothetical protein
MSAQRRDFLRIGFAGAAVAALARTQALAAASTALYRNQLVHTATMGAGESVKAACCPIVELRQYTLQPDTRDRFVALFEREFIDAQEGLGISVIGQFRDQDDANRFVWLRGFPDMSTRAEALNAFYVAPAPAWKAHREEANAMIVDSDNVLLLRAVRPAAEFALAHAIRAPSNATNDPPGLVVATIYYLDAPADADFVDFFERRITPALRESGVTVSAYFASETSANNFLRLPVRENEPVFVWFGLYRDQRDYHNRVAALNGTKRWRDDVATELRHRLKSVPQTLRLTPTPRSLLHG